MAVGKGSMERAAKAAGTDTSAKKTVKKAQTTAKQKPADEIEKKIDAAEPQGQIVYQKSSGMLERAAKPNERFGLGDAMPVYYF